ncbi:MAG: EamA family transporter [Pseudomonadota bacterium]
MATAPFLLATPRALVTNGASLPDPTMRLIDILTAIAVPMIWGFGFALAKDAFDQFPPIFLMCMRFGFAALVLIWFVGRLRPGEAPRLALIAFVGGTLAYGMQFTGLEGLDASTAALIVQLEVVFATIFAAVFLGDRIGWVRAGAMASAFIGIGLIAGEPSLHNSLFHLTLLIIGGIAWAGGQVLIKTLGDFGGLRLITYFAAFVAPQMLVVSLIVEDGQWQAVATASAMDWTKVIYLAFIMTAAGYALWYRLVGRYRLSQVMPFILLVPVTSVAGGIVMLGESLTFNIALGGLIIMGAVAAIQLIPPPPERRPTGEAAD